MRYEKKRGKEMPGKDYKVVSIKQEVVKKIQDRAKREEVSISKLLDNLLSKSSTEVVKTSSNDAAITKELSDTDIKRIATEMLLEIGMHIEIGVAQAVKSLR